MLMRKLEVRLNPLHTQALVVPAWEALILAAIHGQEDVKDVGEEFVDRDYPDPAQEFDRLDRRFHAPAEDPEEPYVAQIFGQGPLGVQQLARMIEHERAAEVAELERLEEEPAAAAGGDAPDPQTTRLWTRSECEDAPWPELQRYAQQRNVKGKSRAELIEGLDEAAAIEQEPTAPASRPDGEPESLRRRTA